MASPPDGHHHPTSASPNSFGIEVVFFIRPREAPSLKHIPPARVAYAIGPNEVARQTGDPHIRPGRGINVVA